ncbi:putative UDP-N-acetylglucosamine diphosphorylase [Kockovaella imperatae]|uniref:UDP-N-acetylglucosamine diphosphorylase n=1 Tax=Kockovaella imperatae TaxID=4999 RepID=A0A1Y1UMC4_9TREE|nr:putative UDP-N-acetylglucosamine diphosphorylase [Kockovaella imperatae]ORX39201.1 putative UDP-N-acetylglucosamine diphosphorylase [Kockovaella imperatae]
MTSAVLTPAANGLGIKQKPYGTPNGFADLDKAASHLRALYTSAGQEHVFHFYDSLSPPEQAALLTQLGSIDINRVNRIYRNAVAADQAITPPTHTIPLDDTLAVGGNMIGRSRSPSPTGSSPLDEAQPLPQAAVASIIDSPAEASRWRGIGLQAVADNQVAVLLMAGGQGTRLGSALPKGMYDISLPSGMSLFEIQATRIRRLQSVAEKECGKPVGSVKIKWYVMTSGPTREATVDFFEKRNFFGLSRDNVIFFEQGTLPALSDDGKLLLSSKSSVAVAPDGNGGLYAALRRPYSPHSSRTVLSDIKDNNIQYIHAYCVDNCLVKVADPVFIGACIARHAAAGAKVVRKLEPTESVGVLAKKGDAYAVVEYSELSKEKAAMRTDDGNLAFWAANIVSHFWTTSFLETVEAMEAKMPFHIARKKIPTIDLDTGAPIKPDSPNGMKLEMFVFDVFPYTRSLCALEVLRAEEFSPLKNAPGSKADCPETSRRDILAQQKRWLIAAGAEVPDGVEIEVTPNVTYAGEGLDFVKGKKLKSGVLNSESDLASVLA